MESCKWYAYNQSRECFLGLEVSVCDRLDAELNNLSGTSAIESGKGFWIKPCSDVSQPGVYSSFDLIYLDEKCRVIDLVATNVSFRETASRLRASSLLVLPTRTILTSETRLGDQLMICACGEMERRLGRLASLKDVAEDAADVACNTPVQSRKESPDPAELQDQASEHPLDAVGRDGDHASEGTKKHRNSLKSWLAQWWSPDPRKASRGQLPGLVAYYWDGGAPVARPIRNISSTGLYLLTEERWYLGTLILMTLKYSSDKRGQPTCSISVHCKVVRCGSDGIGLQFVVLQSAVFKKELERFLDCLSVGKRGVTC
jgi:hypothetical protein